MNTEIDKIIEKAWEDYNSGARDFDDAVKSACEIAYQMGYVDGWGDHKTGRDYNISERAQKKQ